MRDHLFEAITGYHFSPRFAITLSAGLLETSLGPGAESSLPQLSAQFDSSTAPGLENPPDEVVLTTGAIADLRDDRRNPHEGSLLMGGRGARAGLCRLARRERPGTLLFAVDAVGAVHDPRVDGVAGPRDGWKCISSPAISTTMKWKSWS